MMVGCYVEACRRRGLKVNADKTKVMLLGRDEGFKCEVRVDGTILEHTSEFKYLGYAVDESEADDAECRKKMVSERKVAGKLQLKCATWVLLESLFIPLLLYGSETVVWRNKERSRVRAVQMDNLRGVLGDWIECQMHE